MSSKNLAITAQHKTMRIKISTALLLTTTISPVPVGSTNFYGSDGNYQGTIQSAGKNNNFIYDRDGEYVGSTTKAGNSLYFYGGEGTYVGS